jgi:DNA gyrase subunit A
MEIGNVERVDINQQMRTAYLDYAMSVIVSRALPDARDGLKPVHRRILYAMHDMGIRPNSAFKKSARIVGEVLGKYHPHSDQAVYDAMARMAQDFSMRYPLIDGQGNFGSIGGDPPAAMRYTEARLHNHAGEILADIGKDTVDFYDNFDGSLQQPAVLPARLPNLLMNGSSGIAVGMASNIPPHNLNELAGAINYLIDRWDELDNVSVEDLLIFVKGPDFPTGGIILGDEMLTQMYSSGRGRLTVRGRATIEEQAKGRFRIVITEIPYQVNLTTLIEKIAELARNGRLEGVSDLRDESDRNGLSIVLDLKRGAHPRTVLNRLYKYTPLQTTFGAQILALVSGEPLTLSLKRTLQIFIEHRQEVITRRTQYDLDKAKARAHILEGLMIALANIDEVINTIRKAADVDTARADLIKRFKLTEIQAQAILDMQLRRLAALERQKIEDEYKEVSDLIAHLEDLLAHPKKILALIKEDLSELTEKYGDERRTHIDFEGTGTLDEEDLVKDMPVLITITERGYVKRMDTKSFRTQGRGGRGVKGHETRDEDEIMMMLPARTKDTILFFSDRGKVYSQKAYRIPEALRTSKGTPIINILGIGGDETITAAVKVTDFKDAQFCVMATALGKVKRVELAEFESVRPSGLIAIGLNDDDSLGWARVTSGKDELIFVTERGQALRYAETEVRAMGRQAAGVNSIKLRGKDRVTSMEVIEPQGDLLIVTRGGFGKRTSLEHYNPKGRATMGVKTVDDKAIKIIGTIMNARVVQAEDDITIISANGTLIRTKVKNITVSGRATRGVRLMDLNDGDSVASVARIAAADLKQAAPDEKEELGEDDNFHAGSNGSEPEPLEDMQDEE